MKIKSKKIKSKKIKSIKIKNTIPVLKIRKNILKSAKNLEVGHNLIGNNKKLYQVVQTKNSKQFMAHSNWESLKMKPCYCGETSCAHGYCKINDKYICNYPKIRHIYRHNCKSTQKWSNVYNKCIKLKKIPKIKNYYK